ncbi:flocculation protein FLO11-like [Contarinia nasturtii]|uniref:flocculation protein FLO11-like n=1 Tax=Contarinia nasturtii TaxID=265458 RepID=UPI0012D46265|nr:flocculation protein FLO11-like [Contarinia nasturtii]
MSKYPDTTTEQYKTTTLVPKVTTLSNEEKTSATTQSIEHETTLLPTEKALATEHSSSVPGESDKTTKYIDTTTEQFKTSSSSPKLNTLPPDDEAFTRPQLVSETKRTELPTERSFVSESGRSTKDFDTTTEQFKTSSFGSTGTTGTTHRIEKTHPSSTNVIEESTKSHVVTEQSSFVPTESGQFTTTTTFVATEGAFTTEQSSFKSIESDGTTKLIDTTTDQVQTIPSVEKVPSTTQFVDHESTLLPTEKVFYTEKPTTLASKTTTLPSEENVSSTQFVGHEMTSMSTDKSMFTEQSSIASSKSERTTKLVDITTEQIKTSTLKPKVSKISDDGKVTSTTQSIEHKTTLLPTEKELITEQNSFVSSEKEKTTEYFDSTTKAFGTSTFRSKQTTVTIDEMPSSTQFIDIDQETTLLPIEKSSVTERTIGPIGGGKTTKYVDTTTEQFIMSSSSPKLKTLPMEEDIFTTPQLVLGTKPTPLPTDRPFVSESGRSTKYFDTTTEQFKTSSAEPKATTLQSEEKLPPTTQYDEQEITTKEAVASERGSFVPTESGSTTTEKYETSSSISKATTLSSEKELPSSTQFIDIDRETTLLPTERAITTERSTFTPTESKKSTKHFDTKTEQLETKVTTIGVDENILTTTQAIDHKTPPISTEKSFGTDRSLYTTTESEITTKYFDTSSASSGEPIYTTTQIVDQKNYSFANTKGVYH